MNLTERQAWIRHFVGATPDERRESGRLLRQTDPQGADEVEIAAAAEIIYPMKASEFLDMWSRSADHALVKGLSLMTDEEVERLAGGLRAAFLKAPFMIDSFWEWVRAKGRS